MEDGTGEAQLYVYDDIVPTVLKLSSQQWRHLQDLAMRTGELLYQRHRWFGGDRKVKQAIDLLEISLNFSFMTRAVHFPFNEVLFSER